MVSDPAHTTIRSGVVVKRGSTVEVRYVKLNLARFHHISSACNSTSVEAIHYP